MISSQIHDCLEDRAVAESAAAEVVDAGMGRIGVEGGDRPGNVGGVKVVTHLLAVIPVDRVWVARNCALHEVGQETVELGAGMAARQAAAAKTRGPHPEVAAILLDEHVGGDLGGTEQGVVLCRST